MPAQRVPVQFGAQTYQARSRAVNSERCVNLYLEQNPQGSKGQSVLYGTPGLRPWTSVGTGPIRGIHIMEGDISGRELYVVSGNELYQVNSTKGALLIGNIAGTGNVRMVDNGEHVGIATNDLLYAANTTTLTTLTQAGMNGAAFQDGYGIYTKAGTLQFFITNLDDMTTISGLDFSSADAFPDTMVGCISDHRELWLFKERSAEIWYNSGAAAFPFVRVPSGFVERGCKASGSIVKTENAVLWLGDDLRVYAAQGYQPQAISTPAIELYISERGSPQTAEAFVYEQEGHRFYVLTFADGTICYDFSTGLWAERKSDGLERWRANSHAFAFDKNLVGDVATGDIYELDLDYFFDGASDPIRREVTAPPVQGNGHRVFMSELFVDMETGVGLTTGQGSDPQLMLDWSEDGGLSFGTELLTGFGKIGERMTRASFYRLGSFHQRTLRLAISDPVKVAIIQSYARIEAGL